MIQLILLIYIVLNAACAKAPGINEGPLNYKYYAGAPIAWSQLPIKLELHESFPNEFIRDLEDAIKVWESQVNRPLFIIDWTKAPVVGPIKPRQDRHNVIYYVTEDWLQISGHTSNVQAYVNTYDVGNEIIEGDLTINGLNFQYFSFHQLPYYIPPGYTHLQSVLIHELGHMLGLAHCPYIRNSVMYPYFPDGEMRTELTPTDIRNLRSVYQLKF